MDNNPSVPPPALPPQGEGKAIAGLVLGIVGMFFWLLPILGLPVSATGLVLSIQARQGSKKGMALTGLILCIVGLVLTVINAILGAILAIHNMSGR